MEHRQLGRSGLQVSVLGLGTMGFGGGGNFANVGQIGVEGATRQLDLCLDAGVTFVDTANVYSTGVSEEIVGKAIGGRRDRIVLATKARFAMGEGANDAGLSRRHLISECEASLRRLGTDYIDLYQVHEWDGLTPLEETLEALDTLVRSGKVRYVGCSNYSGCKALYRFGPAWSMAFCSCQPVTLLAPRYRTLPDVTRVSSVASVSSIGVAVSQTWV